MATSVAAQPNIDAGDRLGLTLFMALMFHALVILGIGFTADERKPKNPGPLSLEITLVHSASDEAPDDPDYLAQTNQVGGGNVEEQVRPSSPLPIPRPVAERSGDSAMSQDPVSPKPKPRPKEQQVITGERSDLKVSRSRPEPQVAEEQLPSAQELMLRSREIARLSAEIQQRQQSYSKKKKHKYISANTKEYLYASYEEAWRMKVERIGNLNYPDEAKRNKLTGALLLDVAIAPDGSISHIDVLRSSGHKALDDGAMRIVRLAAPFAPFSEKMRKDTDILHIIRLWQFQDDNSLSTIR